VIRLLLARLRAALVTVLLIATASFALLKVAPGGPFDTERALPEAVRREVEASYGLDRPAFVDRRALAEGRIAAAFGGTQYAGYLRRVVRLDLGPSLRYRGRSVNEVLAAGAPVSAALGLVALEVALLLGLPLGIFAALRAGGRFDRGVRAGTSVLVAVPNFLLATGLLAVLGLGLGWLPVAGIGTPRHLLLPVIALALPYAATIARLVRASLLETLYLDFVRAARARGLTETAVVVRHALRPALVPVVAYLGPAAAGLATGSLVIESIFNIPGMGAHFVNGALNRDYGVILGAVLVYSAVLLACNAIADVAAAALDPRLRAAGAGRPEREEDGR